MKSDDRRLLKRLWRKRVEGDVVQAAVQHLDSLLLILIGI